MNIEFPNADRVIRGLQQQIDRNKGLSIDAVEEVADQVLKEAQARCPVDTGQLRDSGRVLKRRTRKEDVERRVIKFGNAKAYYAAFVHYTPAKHDTGEDLFLDKAVAVHGPKLPQLISSKIRFRKIT